jgi:hypothetical protein
MAIKIQLVKLQNETGFVPLGVLGYCLTRTKFLEPVFQELKLPLKTVDHAPEHKLLDLLVSMLTSCRSISQVNTRTRPDMVLAKAWGREQFAEQSTLARTLDVFDQKSLSALRTGSQALYYRESHMLRHDFARDWLYIDIDLTPLPISKQAEASTKGHMGKKMPMAGS